jgi:hypothetical protein
VAQFSFGSEAADPNVSPVLGENIIFQSFQLLVLNLAAKKTWPSVQKQQQSHIMLWRMAINSMYKYTVIQ